MNFGPTSIPTDYRDDKYERWKAMVVHVVIKKTLTVKCETLISTCGIN